MRTPSGFSIAKHLTRKKSGGLQKCKWLSFIGWCLTKPERSCKGLTDTSHLVYPYPSPQCLGGVGNAPVISRAGAIKKGFIGSFMLKRLKKICLHDTFLNP